MELTETTTKIRTRWAVGAMTAFLAVGAVACGGDGADSADDAAASGPVAAGAPVEAIPVAEDGSASATPAGGSGSPAAPASPTPTTAPTVPPVPAPRIDSFTTPEDIDCHNGPVQHFTASWTTTGAERVTISIDGPGIYAEYAPDGETSLPFNCSTPHSFLLTAYGPDGQTTAREVTLHPRNVQPDPDEGIDDLSA